MRSGNRERRQFATKREADAFRVELEAQIRAGTYRPEAAKVTVKEAADAYLEHSEVRMKRGERMNRHSLAVYAGHAHNYIVPDPGRHAAARNGQAG